MPTRLRNLRRLAGALIGLALVAVGLTDTKVLAAPWLVSATPWLFLAAGITAILAVVLDIDFGDRQF